VKLDRVGAAGTLHFLAAAAVGAAALVAFFARPTAASRRRKNDRLGHTVGSSDVAFATPGERRIISTSSRAKANPAFFFVFTDASVFT
jgi:hypothetical protein